MGVGTPVACTTLIAPAPVAWAMAMQSSIVGSPGGKLVPGSAVHRPSMKVTRTPWSATLACRSASWPPLRTNREGVVVTHAKPAAAAAAASSTRFDRRKV